MMVRAFVLLSYLLLLAGPAVAQDSPRGPFKEPPIGIENLRVVEEQQSQPGSVSGCVEKNPPEWAVPFLRGETDRIDFPEPVYPPGVSGFPAQ